MSTELVFYHTSTPLTRLLPILVEKTYAQGKRCLIYVDHADACASWNTQLWTYSTLSFLPHASDLQQLSPEQKLHQPIFITEEQENSNQAEIIFNLRSQYPQSLDTVEKIVEFPLCFFQGDPSSFSEAICFSIAQERNRAYCEQIPTKGTFWSQKPDGTWEQTSLVLKDRTAA